MNVFTKQEDLKDLTSYIPKDQEGPMLIFFLFFLAALPMLRKVLHESLEMQIRRQ